MPLPGVKISLLNGQLGRVASLADGVFAMLAKAATTGTLAYVGKATVIYSVADAVAAGITVAAEPAINRQITEFYAQSGDGQELWLWVAASTATPATALAADADADKLMAACDYKASVVGVLIDTTTTSQAHTFADRMAGRMAPVRCLIGKKPTDITTETSLKTESNNRAAVVTFSTQSDGVPAIGTMMGRMSRISVQENPGKVKLGDLGLAQAWIGSKTIAEYTSGQLDSFHDKGYIFARKHTGLAGFFISDDPTATANTDDYSSLTRGRLMDKVHRIVYATLMQEVLGEVPIKDGKLSPEYVASLKGSVDNALLAGVVNSGNASSAYCYIDPNQDILATDKLKVGVSVVPVGQAKSIEANIGFTKQ